jgi:[DsrC]-trisulfide reductase subunit M
MNVNYVISLLAVIALVLIAFIGSALPGGQALFGIWIPYVAVLLFIWFFCRRIIDWARCPVPFRITSTCGQQQSLKWIRHDPLENPTSTFQVVVRMILEVFAFRSLFRNTRATLKDNGKLVYNLEKWLWLGAIAFHYAFLVVVLRHFRFFLEPVPAALGSLENLDGFLQVGLPGVMLSGFVLLAAVTYLFLRRILNPQVRYISLTSDFFPLFLIFAIAASGLLMRYVTKTDVVGIKGFIISLLTLHPSVPAAGLSGIFYVHLFLVSVLLAYFPFSKLMHVGGVLMSPTRNMTANSRAVRHVNPWNYPVEVHTYDEYEEEFREKMIEAGLPVEKE